MQDKYKVKPTVASVVTLSPLWLPCRLGSHAGRASRAPDREAARGAGKRLGRGVFRVPGLGAPARHYALRPRLLPPLHRAGHRHGAGMPEVSPTWLKKTRDLLVTRAHTGERPLPSLSEWHQDQRAGGVPAGGDGGRKWRKKSRQVEDQLEGNAPLQTKYTREIRVDKYERQSVNHKFNSKMKVLSMKPFQYFDN